MYIWSVTLCVFDCMPESTVMVATPINSVDEAIKVHCSNYKKDRRTVIAVKFIGFASVLNKEG